MEQSIKDLLSTAQVKSERNTLRAEFYTKVQRVIKEQADEIAKLKAEAESGGSTNPSAFRKAFLLGAGYGANFQASYVQEETRDLEHDVYSSVCDNGLYMDMNGTLTIDAMDLTDHLSFRQINLADLDDIRTFLDMKDEDIMDKLASVGVGVRTFNLDKSTDNETQETAS